MGTTDFPDQNLRPQGLGLIGHPMTGNDHEQGGSVESNAGDKSIGPGVAPDEDGSKPNELVSSHVH